MRALDGKWRDVAKCRRGKTWGKGSTTITFAGDGSVSHVEVGTPFAGTPTGDCIAGALSSTRVEPFGDSEAATRLPRVRRTEVTSSAVGSPPARTARRAAKRGSRPIRTQGAGGLTDPIGCPKVHPHIIISGYMSLGQYVGTLNLLGDESRIRLCALLRERELTVTDLVRVTGISQSRVSTHLARLREAGFVRDRREGQHSFYALAVNTLPGTAKAVLEEATSSADPTLEGDQRRLLELDAEQRGGLPDAFAGEMHRHYSPGRTWESLATGIAALLRLGDVLDVGSGDGAAAAYLAPHCRSLVCIDTSPRMIDAARERLAAFPNVRAQVADVHELPFRASSFDSVIMFHTLTYAEHPQRALEECARVLRPGARLVLLSLDKHDQGGVTAPYGERHTGFAPRTLRALLSRAGLGVTFADVACREAKKPHFRVVLAVAEKPRSGATKNTKSG